MATTAPRLGAGGRSGPSPVSPGIPAPRPTARARRPTAAAPTSGPSVAQAGGDDPGVPGEVEPGPQLDLLLGGIEERGPEAEGHRPATTASSSRADWPPRPPPGRPWSRCDGAPRRVRRPAARPVIASMASPDASASRQPRPPHTHGRPSGSTTTWPMCPALPCGAVEQPTVEHDAAADAGGHHHGQVVRTTPGRPSHPSPRASALASLSTATGSPTSVGQPIAQGKPPPGRDVERRHRLPAGRHRTPAATPQTTGGVHRGRPDLAITDGQGGEDHLGDRWTSGWRPGRRPAWRRRRSTSAGGHLGAADVDGQHRSGRGRGRPDAA